MQFHWVDILHFIYTFTNGGCLAVAEVNMNAGMLVFVSHALLPTGWASRREVNGSHYRCVLNMEDTVDFLARQPCIFVSSLAMCEFQFFTSWFTSGFQL